MKELQIEGIISCPKCDGYSIVRQNARNEFQIKCSHCRYHTEWSKKHEAIIKWYNEWIRSRLWQRQ